MHINTRNYVIILLVFPWTKLVACDCDGPVTIREAFNRSQLIFRGTVIEESLVLYSTVLKEDQVKVLREKYKSNEKQLAQFESQQVVKFTFRVVEVIKGVGVEYTVTVLSDQTSCGMVFRKKADYLVYSFRSGLQGGFLKDGYYWTEYCSRSAPFREQERLELMKCME